jgi:bacterial transferase hexapeptide repeat protein
MKDKKYEILKGDSKPYYNNTVYRIKALKDFGDVKAGDVGGYIQSEEHLSHTGNCWVYDDAVVYDHAKVKNNAKVFNNAEVGGYSTGDAQVLDTTYIDSNARVCGMAIIKDCTHITGYARIDGQAIVCGDSVIDKNTVVDGKTYIEDGLLNKSQDYVTIHPVGEFNAPITAFMNRHGEIMVSENKGDRFFGTFARFERVIQGRYEWDNYYLEEYKDLMEYIMKFFHLDD